MQTRQAEGRAKSGEGTRVTVEFELPATVEAEEVAVVGDFNGWNPGANRLARAGDGTWRLSLQLEPNRQYRYSYVLDRARWAPGWLMAECEPMRSGGCLAVLET